MCSCKASISELSSGCHGESFSVTAIAPTAKLKSRAQAYLIERGVLFVISCLHRLRNDILPAPGQGEVVVD